MELEIYFITNKFLGNINFAKNLYNFLINSKFFKPDKIGNFEPIKNIFTSQFKDFMGYWYDKNLINMNTILWKNKKKNTYGMLDYGKGKAPVFNTIHLVIKYLKLDNIDELVKEVSLLFDSNSFLFGRICLKEEYDKYNILKNTNFFYNNNSEKIYFNDGGTCPVLAVGTNIQKQLPGIYWNTLLGSIYVDWIGRENILKTPAYKITELENGSIALQAYEKPEYYCNDSEIKIVKNIKNHLGYDIFFDITYIDRTTKAPEIDTCEITEK